MTLLDASAVKVSLVVLFGLAAMLLLRHRSAAVRHWVLAFALACAAVTPALEAMVPSWWYVPLDTPAPPRLVETRVIAIRPAWVPEADAAPTRQDITVKFRHAADSGQAPWGGIDPTAVRRTLTRVWLAGAAIGLTSVLFGLVWLARLTARARPMHDARWLETGAAVAREYGLRRPVRLLLTDQPNVLVTWGVLRPAVIVPAAATFWAEERIRAVLCHEYAHVRRADWMVQALASLLRSVYWFNPLLWLACRRLRQESEQACDDAVLRRGIAAHDYASHLVDIARAFRRHGPAWSPAPAVARPSSLERRVTAMLDGDLNRTPLSRVMGAAIVAALLGAVVPIAGFGAPQEPAMLVGDLRDPEGLPVANGRMYLTNVATGEQIAFTTNADGRFEFSGLVPGDYRVTTLTSGAQFTVRLEAGDRLERDLRLGFGPFRERWMIVTSNLKNGPRPARMPADWGCASSGPPLCGPESLVREFETDEQARLSAPVVAPRRVIDPVQDFQAFRDLDVEGEVTLEGRIGADGVLTSVRVLSTADAALANAALDAVRNMRWEPARLRGVPTDVPLTITIEVLREPRGPARR